MKYFVNYAVQGICKSISIYAKNRVEAYDTIYQSYPGATILNLVSVHSEYEFPE